jgi:hypothetical protein
MKYNELVKDFALVAVAAQIVALNPIATANRAEAKTHITPIAASILGDIAAPGVSARFAKGALGLGQVLDANTAEKAQPNLEAEITPFRNMQSKVSASWTPKTYTPA